MQRIQFEHEANDSAYARSQNPQPKTYNLPYSSQSLQEIQRCHHIT